MSLETPIVPTRAFRPITSLVRGRRQNPSRQPLSAGSLLARRYRVRDTLAQGATAKVYRARDLERHVDVALKVLSLRRVASEMQVACFWNEVLVSRHLDHPRVVGVRDFGREDDHCFLAMDLIEGPNLRQVLDAEGPLDEATVRFVLRQLAGALEHVHGRSVVHRDLKPENVLVDTGGDVYLTDFGLASAPGTHEPIDSGGLVGSPDYLSPEQARGERADARSDGYSLGLIAVELLCGRSPYGSGTLIEIVARHAMGRMTSFEDLGVEVSADLRGILERCLETDPAARYLSAGDLAAALGPCPRPDDWPPATTPDPNR